ncbi:MAG: hypothetical protein Q9225_002623 [Loekoesia sp. 1 TL-2023]
MQDSVVVFENIMRKQNQELLKLIEIDHVLTWEPSSHRRILYRFRCTASSSVQSNPEVQPCNGSTSTDGFSMCCATNRHSDNPSPNESCQENGLCRWFNPKDSANQTWRETCTDPSWESPNCVKFCINGTEERHRDRSTTEAQVTPCGDGTYCCGANQIDCCVKHEGVFLVNGTTSAPLPSSTSSTSSTPQASTTPTVPGTKNTPDPLPDKESSNTAKKIGIGVGVGVLCLLILLGLIIGVRRRISKSKEDQAESRVTAGQDEPKVRMGIRDEKFTPVEVEGRGLIHELEDDRNRWGGEMNGEGVRAELDGMTDFEDERKEYAQKTEASEVVR